MNPYTEPDEEEEKAKEEEEKKRDDDYVMLLRMLFQLQSWTFLRLLISDGFEIHLH